MVWGIEPGEDGAKKPDQPSAEEAEVVPDAGEGGIDGISVDAAQVENWAWRMGSPA